MSSVTVTGASGVIHNGSTEVFSVIASHQELAAQWLCLYDTNAAPTGSDSARLHVLVPPGDSRVLGSDELRNGENGTMATGLAYAWATGPGSFAAATMVNTTKRAVTIAYAG